MTHFPQPNPQRRAPRVRLENAAPVLLMLEDGQRAKGRLQTLSVTGGLLRLPKALEHGDFVEVSFQTQSGTVHGMAEMLNPTRSVPDGTLQPFRFIALADDDHRTVRMLVDSASDRDFLHRSSNRWSSLT